jgi:hypothetical protein
MLNIFINLLYLGVNPSSANGLVNPNFVSVELVSILYNAPRNTQILALPKMSDGWVMLYVWAAYPLHPLSIRHFEKGFFLSY